MKKYYVITLSAVFMLVIMQVNYIRTVYGEYNNQCKNEINNIIYTSIDREINIRTELFNGKMPSSKPLFFHESIDEMDPYRRDSLLKLHPLPLNPPQYDVEQLRDLDIIRSTSDIGSQLLQDRLPLEGYPLNLIALDSLFSFELSKTIPHNFILSNKNGNCISESNSSKKRYQYHTSPYIIGLESRQELVLNYDIPFSSFIIHSIWSLIASLIMIAIAAGALITQILIIRRKQKRLEYINQNINATIHDLKSPLSGVSMVLDLASKKIESKEMDDIFTLSQSKIKHLIGNIDSLLTIARKDNGKMILQKQSIDTKRILEIVSTTTAQIDSLYSSKRHIFEIENNLSDNCLLHADPLCMESIIYNLLENAIKYSDNEVVVKIKIDDSDKSINFTINDNGWGIPQKYIKKLYKEYFRVPRKNDNQRGYGIGLTQVKYLVELHHGTVVVESEEGIGTTFFITLAK